MAVDELEFEEDAAPMFAEDRVIYRASVAGFPVSVAVTNAALAKLWPTNRAPTDVHLLDRFDELHVTAQSLIGEKYRNVGPDENNAILLTDDDIGA